MSDTKLQVVQAGAPHRDEEPKLTLAEKLKRKAELLGSTVDSYPYEQVAKEMVAMAVAWIEGDHVKRTAELFPHETPTAKKLSAKLQEARDSKSMKPWLDAAAKAVGMPCPGVEVCVYIRIDLDRVAR